MIIDFWWSLLSVILHLSGGAAATTVARGSTEGRSGDGPSRKSGEADCAFLPEDFSGSSSGWAEVAVEFPNPHPTPPGEFPEAGDSGCNPDPAPPPPG